MSLRTLRHACRIPCPEPSAQRVPKRRLRLLAVIGLLAVSAVSAQAQYTLVDSGSSSSFTAPVANASNYLWTLDGTSVGTNNRVFSYGPDMTQVGTHELAVAQALATGGTATQRWGVRVRIPIPSSPTKFYVSTSGSDTNNGSIGAPFKTLEGALSAIRALPKPLPDGGVTVFLRSGTHWRTSTFTLTGSDSGTPNAPIIISSYPGENAVISTGTAIATSAWAPLALSETNRVMPGVDVSRIWETSSASFSNKGPYPAKYGTWPVRNALAVTNSVPDVFYKGSRAWLSRYPNHHPTDDSQTTNLKMNGVVPDVTGTAYLNNSGTYMTSGGTSVFVGGAFKYYPADASHVDRWKTAISKGGVWLQGFWRVTWQCDLAQVLDIDTGKQVFEMHPSSTPSGGFGNKFTRPVGNLAEPFCVVNLLEEMDQPGEWAMDFSRNKLYFMMDTAGAPPSGSVVVADYAGPVMQISGSNVILQSLTFDQNLGVGVLLSNTASRNLVAGCTFRNMTNMAVSIQSGSMNGVVSCDMSDFGSMAIQITASGTAGSATPNQSNYIVNNKFVRIARYAQMYQPGVNVVYPAAGNRVSHNYMYDQPHMGVQFGGYRNIYEYNDISKYGFIVDDNGGYYSYEDWYGDDTFRYNFTHDTPLASSITYDGVNRVVTGHYYGNVTKQDASCEGQSIGIGLLSKVDVVNNLSIGGGRYGNFVFTTGSRQNINNNVTINGYYPPDFRWTLATLVGGSNVYTTSNSEVLGNGPNISLDVDPGFVDMANQDYRLRPDASLFDTLPDFKPIPFEMIGLYNDEYRSDGVVLKPYAIAQSGSFASSTQAVLTGTLVFPQYDLNTSVSIYYGSTDSGTNAAGWAHVVNLGVLPAGTFSTTVSTASGQPVYYRVLATNPAGSTWSENTMATYPGVPSQPTGVTVTPGYAQNVVSWNAATYAASYTIMRATSPGGPYVVVATGVTDTTFTDVGLVTGQTYYYTVTAVNGTGSSSATTPSQGAPVPGTAVKAGNTDPLDQSSSWVATATPTIQDVALWDDTFAYNSVGVGSGLQAKQIKVNNPVQAFTISAGSGSVVLGSGGIDLTAATQNLTIAAPVVLNASQAWNVASGRTLTVSGAISDGGQNYTLTIGGTGTQVLNFANSYRGTLSITPPAGGLPVYNYGTNNPSGYVKVNSGAVGSVIANGRLDILSGSVAGTISGSGTTGYVSSQNPNNNTLTFAAGSTFSIFNVGSTNASATLTSTGTAGIYFGRYGYNTTAVNSAHTFNGGLWLIGMIGQNNTGAQMSGTTIVAGGANVRILTQTAFSHGTWNVLSGTLQFAGGVSETHGSATATNTALVLNASNAGTILINGGLTLANGGSTTEVNTASVGAGGLFYLQAGNLVLGSTTTQSAEVDTFNLAGGKLLVNGVISASASGTGQTRYFNWSGGQLTATSITTGTGFNTPAAGGISANTLIQASGTLAPGDVGTAGKTTVTGSYSLGSGGVLAVDLGGTTQATGFQTGLYDYLVVTGASNLAGKLAVSLTNGFTPTAGQTFTIMSSTAGITGGFSNLVTGNRVVTTNGKGSFVVTVNATTVTLSNYAVVNPPVVSVPANQTLEATGATGAATTFSTSATDWLGNSVATTNTPASGSTFPVGVSTVQATATDLWGNSGTNSFTVTVRDTTAPVVTVPSNIIAEATSSAGAAVSFSSSATDLVSGNVSTTNTPASGSTFPIGTTTVQASATDAAGNTGSNSFTVTVSDTTPPVISVPGTTTVEATSASGAVVNFSTSATDAVSGACATVATPASGSVFPLGNTTVVVTSSDALGNQSSRSFQVTVQDTTAPSVSVPANISVPATGSNGATVTFSTTAADLVDGSVATTNTPASGSIFPMGTTTVTASATDTAGNTGSNTFTVTVTLPVPGAPTMSGQAGNHAATLTWSPVVFATSYNLKRSTSSGGPYTTIATALTGTSYVDSGLPNSASYYYVLSGVDATGEGPGSSEVAVTLGAAVIQKADNTNALNLGTSWVSGTAPSLGDTALWAGTYTSGSASLGTGLTLGSIQVGSVSRALTLTPGTGTLSLSAPAGVGIDMSAATQDLTISAPVTLAGSQVWLVPSPRTLTISGAIGESVTGSGILLSSTGTVVFSGTNTFTGGVTVAGPAGGQPTYKFGGNNPSAYAKVTGGSIGRMTVNGRLDITAAATIASIAGSGTQGLVNYSSTNGNIMTFEGGSTFSLFQFGSNLASGTLRQTGTGGVWFSFFGYNTSTPSARLTFDGGTWLLGQVGQNNTGAQVSGSMAVTNGASVSVVGNTNFAHGAWNVSNATLTFAGAVAELNGNANTPLALSVGGTSDSAGVLNIGGSLGLADGGGTSNTNILSVLNGGSALVSGNLTLGSTTARTAETDTVNLQGGKLLVNGAISAAATTTGQTRKFNWTGGQLSAAIVTSGTGFAAPGSGGITTNSLVQTSGTLAPGDAGIAGRTVINGSYNLGAAGAFSVDLTGTVQASGFQTGSYDYVTVSGSTTLAGRLVVAVGNGFAPNSTQSFTVLQSTGALSGSFANVAFGSRVMATDGTSSFVVSSTSNRVVLGSYGVITTPTITSAPDSGIINQGDAANFTLSATGSPLSPITYQWYKNGVAIPGATSATYSIAAIQASDAGNYYAVASNLAGSTTSQTFTVSVSNVPSPWVATDIGAPGVTGNATATSGTYQVTGAGADIGSTADAFTYVYQVGSGDCSVTAKVTGLENTSSTAKVGVMIRDSLASNAIESLVSLNPLTNVIFQNRTTTAGGTSVAGSGSGAVPYWIRLTRTGDVIRAYSSADGTTWTQVGSDTTVVMGANVYIGLAVCSQSTTTANHATFTNVTVAP